MELIRGVCPTTDQDIEQVAGLEQVCFSENWSKNLIHVGLDSRLDMYFVYMNHGAILGYAVVRILVDEGGIQRTGVYPSYRRQGIARELMGVMVAFAGARGVRAITLEVRESNLGARKLYDSYGLRQEAVRKRYYHNPAGDATVMWNRAM